MSLLNYQMFSIINLKKSCLVVVKKLIGYPDQYKNMQVKIKQLVLNFKCEIQAAFTSIIINVMDYRPSLSKLRFPC